MQSKVVVITGCSSGIGLETARYLRDKGLCVYPTARGDADVRRLQEEFDTALRLDVTEPETITETIAAVLEKEGRIDVWFNNAGYGQPGALEDIRTEVLREQFETNVFGLHECTRQILPVMLRQGQGVIIQHSSVLGLVSLFGRGAYNASKYAIEGLSDTLRLELQDTNVYVTLLNTGPITSDFRKNAIAKLRQNVAIERSRFKARYEKSMAAKKSEVPFNLPASAVAQVVYRIVTAKRPKPRYYITKATYLLGFAKRILPTAWLDKLVLRIG